MIHGLPTNWSAKDVGHPQLDWTQGCIALTNLEMDEIWKLVSDGTQIELSLDVYLFYIQFCDV